MAISQQTPNSSETDKELNVSHEKIFPARKIKPFLMIIIIVLILTPVLLFIVFTLINSQSPYFMPKPFKPEISTTVSPSVTPKIAEETFSCSDCLCNDTSLWQKFDYPSLGVSFKYPSYNKQGCGFELVTGTLMGNPGSLLTSVSTSDDRFANFMQVHFDTNIKTNNVPQYLLPDYTGNDTIFNTFSVNGIDSYRFKHLINNKEYETVLIPMPDSNGVINILIDLSKTKAKDIEKEVAGIISSFRFSARPDNTVNGIYTNKTLGFSINTTGSWEIFELAGSKKKEDSYSWGKNFFSSGFGFDEYKEIKYTSTQVINRKLGIKINFDAPGYTDDDCSSSTEIKNENRMYCINQNGSYHTTGLILGAESGKLKVWKYISVSLSGNPDGKKPQFNETVLELNKLFDSIKFFSEEIPAENFVK